MISHCGEMQSVYIESEANKLFTFPVLSFDFMPYVSMGVYHSS